MHIWYIVLAAGVGLLAGLGAYYVAQQRAAPQLLTGLLLGTRQAVGEYLQTHPTTPGELNALIAAVYYRLPAGVQARYALDQLTHDLVPLLYQVEEALRTPPPAGRGGAGPDDATPPEAA
jgi:hypothetical protein